MNQNKSIIPKRWTYELPYEILNDSSLKKIRNLKEIPEKLSIDGNFGAGHWRAKFKRKVLETAKKSCSIMLIYIVSVPKLPTCLILEEIEKKLNIWYMSVGGTTTMVKTFW